MNVYTKLFFSKYKFVWQAFCHLGRVWKPNQKISHLIVGEVLTSGHHWVVCKDLEAYQEDVLFKIISLDLKYFDIVDIYPIKYSFY